MFSKTNWDLHENDMQAVGMNWRELFSEDVLQTIKELIQSQYRNGLRLFIFYSFLLCKPHKQLEELQVPKFSG